MGEQQRVTAAAVIIGNEILSGRTQDVNLAYLGARLNELGIQLAEARVVADREEAIVAAVNACREAYDYVFTTGGIGPTHDDITSACVAKAFGERLIRHPQAERVLRARYEQMGVEVTPARLRMAETPESATVIENEFGGAPGYKVGNVFVMAGIPRVMQAMFEAARPYLEGGVVLLSRTVGCYVPEGSIARGLGELQDAFADLDIGSYPFSSNAGYGTNLVLRGPEEARLDEALAKLRALIVELGGEPIEGGV